MQIYYKEAKENQELGFALDGDSAVNPITQLYGTNVTAKKQFVDKFTALMIIILLIQVIMAALSKKKKENHEQPE